MWNRMSFLEPGLVSEVVDNGRLLADLMTDFHWRIRMTPPSTRRFPLTTHTRNREVIAKLSCRRLPSTIAEFRDFVNSRCPNTEGRGFRLRCCVWPTSPYAVVPVQFSEDLHFSTSHSDEIGEISELENAKYRNLVNGCRQFATNCPRREVEFEIKILFSKVVGAAAERK